VEHPLEMDVEAMLNAHRGSRRPLLYGGEGRPALCLATRTGRYG
jgi:hypothetical protein